jgi:hypothetical protein
MPQPVLLRIAGVVVFFLLMACIGRARDYT